MSTLHHAVFRECTSPHCAFRFPDIQFLMQYIPCPRCGDPAIIIHHVDLLKEDQRKENYYPNSSNIVCVLDNIRSVYNVGSIFRTMQGFSISCAFLCGITPSPDHKNFSKTSMGAELEIQWQVEKNAHILCETLKKQNVYIISLETDPDNAPLNIYKPIINDKKVALVVGNEITGIDPSILDISDRILSIPMVGKNKSFNVAVAIGISLYAMLSNG